MAGDYSDIENFPSNWPLIRVGECANVKGGERLRADKRLLHGAPPASHLVSHERSR